ncbi:hypothetical protein HHI36_015363 [Cryptolaemus montrouzieri]|uniref:FYVE-type domain-containing protein n=1 Tax=Cryptolaemus montrouzieri TaxID=559131 RepID=A0ABD2N5T0_9CUCU
MHCAKCKVKGDSKSHFVCDKCRTINCSTCAELALTEERCIALKERKLIALCLGCSADFPKTVQSDKHYSEKTESLYKHLEQALEKLDAQKRACKELVEGNQRLKIEVQKVEQELLNSNTNVLMTLSQERIGRRHR